MLSDRKGPKETPARTKLIKRYDIFTGEMTQRKVHLTAKPLKEKSNYDRVAETNPISFGRSQGIC